MSLCGEFSFFPFGFGFLIKFLVGIYNAGYQLVTHNIFLVQFHKADAFHTFQEMCIRDRAYTPPEEKPSFSQMEINHIRVTTPGLFDNEKLLELHLEQIPDTAYCFPLPGGKVISPYGRGGGRHSGIDIKTCAKDTIRSA